MPEAIVLARRRTPSDLVRPTPSPDYPLMRVRTPGWYEAFRHPLWNAPGNPDSGRHVGFYVPCYVGEWGNLIEGDPRTSLTPPANTLFDWHPDDYADRYGPFRRVSDDEIRAIVQMGYAFY